ncbi:MAG: hypothetical protein WAQ22_00200 [Candidatus Saccharimonas sp.]
MNEEFPQSHTEEIPPQQQIEQPTFNTLDGHLSITTPQHIEVSIGEPVQEFEHAIDRRDSEPSQELKRPDTTAEQDRSVETGLVALEREKTLEKGDIDNLQHKASELNGIHDVQRGLEISIIESGLQVMANRYGGDKLLTAMQTRGVWTFQGVIEQLAPDKDSRQALYDAIKHEPMDALANSFNETFGGVTNWNMPDVTAIERLRKFEVFSIENKRAMKDVDGNKVHRERNTGGYTDSAGLVLNGDFDNLLNNHPEVAQQFRESNDTLVLLEGIRAVYATEYAQFSDSLEKAKATVEAKIAEGEAGIAQLQAISDDVYYDEIAKLEERIASADSDTTKEMLQGMLDRKTEEFMATHEEFKEKSEAARNKVIADLGAERLNQLLVAAPAKPSPIYNDKEKYVA